MKIAANHNEKLKRFQTNGPEPRGQVGERCEEDVEQGPVEKVVQMGMRPATSFRRRGAMCCQKSFVDSAKIMKFLWRPRATSEKVRAKTSSIPRI